MRFTLPRDIYHGKDSLEALKSFTGKKAFVCVGGIEAIAVLIVTSCLIPIGVLLFFLWLVKLVFSIDVNNFSFIRRE